MAAFATRLSRAAALALLPPTQDGTTKMPAFDGVLDQKAAWAIRSYIETRPYEGALDAHSDRLHAIRDALAAWGDGAAAGVDAIKSELAGIAAEVKTGSGAPVADSVAFRAARVIGVTPASFKTASETLTVGLSAAQ